MKIAILGCGWLGLPLAKVLMAQGHDVNGSTTSPEKAETLAAAGIQPFVLHIHENGIEGKIKLFLEGVETLVVDIPPKLRGRTPENFVKKIQQLIPALENAAVKNVLFISSTSVYRNDNSTVTEETAPFPETESGKQLLASETLLQATPAFKTTVLRFAGLTGPDRHPVHHLAGKTDLKNPEAPVNLIHLNDCIAVILEIIQQQKWGDVYNAAHPSHPSREAYYSSKAKELGLTPPRFDSSSGTAGKIISSEKLRKVLKYTFKEII